MNTFIFCAGSLSLVLYYLILYCLLRLWHEIYLHGHTQMHSILSCLTNTVCLLAMLWCAPCTKACNQGSFDLHQECNWLTSCNANGRM